MSTTTGRAFAVSVMSYDKVGIISNVTGTLFELGGNIDRISQTVVDGCFTIVLTVVFDDDRQADAICAAIRERGTRLDLDVSVRPYDHASAVTARTGSVYFLTATGTDRKGIFHDISTCLAGHGVNILDLHCAIQQDTRFVLVGEVDIPADRDVMQIQIDLEELGRDIEMVVRIQHEDLFHATSDLYMSRRVSSTQRSTIG